MHKILLFLNSGPGHGGNFQYDQTVLNAALSLPEDQYRLVVLYTNDVWEKHLSKEITPKKISSSPVYERFIKILIMSGISVNVLRPILGYLDPVIRNIQSFCADLHVFPCQDAFWGYLVNGSSLLTIHDLMHRYESRFPEVSENARFRYREIHFANICRYAVGILAESNVGREHIMSSYGVSPGKIHILPYTAPSYIRGKAISKDFDSRYDLPQKYLFYPAQFWQHKNHLALIKAVELARKEIPDIRLVLVGAKKNAFKKVLDLVYKLHIEDAVLFRDYIPEYDMREFYRKARALIMPTFFGPTNLPPLEAFAVGCPVAVSNIYGIPDQVANAALLFNPESAREIAEAIKSLWVNDALCQELIRKGKIIDNHLGQAAFNKRFAEIIKELLSVALPR